MSVTFHRPTRLEELFQLLQESPPPETSVIAGGTDLLGALDQGRFRPRHLVSLTGLPLGYLRPSEGELRIGSTLPLREIERWPEIGRWAPHLLDALKDVGSVALRHRATLGGNLVRASPASDLLPPLIAGEARVTLLSSNGRRELSVEDFLKGSWETALHPGEIVEEIRLPGPRAGAFLWQRVKPANDISQVAVAVTRQDPGGPGGPWRLAAGGVEPCPRRLYRTEEVLSEPWPSPRTLEEAVQRAREEVVFRTDRRATEEYRRHLLGVLLERAVRRTLERAGPGTRGEGGIRA
jgi:CO/xanthine dehydrogenase FAD-binding subunit